eukprot:gene3693-6507_t
MNNNGGMSEEDALMMALQLSMQEDQNIKIDPKSQGSSGMKSVLKQEIKTDGGQTIQVRKGDLTQEEVGAIVNASNDRLDHCDGLAGAIVKAGGRIIQKESDEYFKTYGKLKEGEIFVTSAGSLTCKYVIHAVGPIWRKGQNNEKENLEKAVLNSFVEASNRNLSNISIPAISSGIFGFPKDYCAEIMFETALNFFENNPKSTLKEIRFVNFDDNTVEVFEQEFKNRFSDYFIESKQIEETTKKPVQLETIDYSKLTEDEQMKLAMEQSMQDSDNSKTETSWESVKTREYKDNDRSIQIRIGDLTEEIVDCIVNAANSRLDHSAGVAGAIVNKGGEIIQKECDKYMIKNGKMNDGDIFVSSGGKLKAKYIIHTIGPLWSGGKYNKQVCEEDYLLALSVYHTLLAANHLKLKSISIPAISSGKFGYPKIRCAKVLLDVANYFYGKYSKDCSVNEIRFTNFDSETLDIFEREFDGMQETMVFGDGNYKPLIDFEKLESRVNKNIPTSMDSGDDKNDDPVMSQQERMRLARLEKFGK